MILVGWVPLQRSIWEHTLTGHLSANEAVVLILLISLADHKTGSGRINAPALRTWFPEMSNATSKRVLTALQEKGCIFREVIFKSKRVYRYWVEGYQRFDGTKKMFQTSIAKALISNDPNDVEWVELVPQTEPQTTPQGGLQRGPQGAHYNKTETVQVSEQIQPPTVQVGVPLLGVHGETEERIACDTGGEGCAPQAPLMFPTSSAQVPMPWSGVGMSWSGPRGVFVDVGTGNVLLPLQVKQRISPVGLEMVGMEFFDTNTKSLIPWADAQIRITGSQMAAYGFIPFLISAARRTGLSAFIGDGANRWPAVHRQDAATLFRLAVERAPASSILHGAGESAITFETIAHLIGRMLQIPTASVAPEDAVNHFQNPFFAKAFAADAPVSSAYTRKLLNWNPTHATLLEDLEASDYFSLQAASAFNKAAH